MIFTVKDKQLNVLFTGTKQECMHFIKREKYNRQAITIQTLDKKPAPHYTIPITADEGPPKNWFKRNFF